MDKTPPGRNHSPALGHPNTPQIKVSSTERSKGLSHLCTDGYHCSVPRRTAGAGDKLNQKNPRLWNTNEAKNAFTQPRELFLPNCAGYTDREQTGLNVFCLLWNENKWKDLRFQVTDPSLPYLYHLSEVEYKGSRSFFLFFFCQHFNGCFFSFTLSFSEWKDHLGTCKVIISL